MRRIGVLTSGGDAPGMNAAIRAVVRVALDRGIAVDGICEGYEGLLRGGEMIRPLGWTDVGGILQAGGTILGTARSPGFRTPEGRRQAVRHLLERGIDGLVVIGGDGSLSGAQALHDEWPAHVAALAGEGLAEARDRGGRRLHVVGLPGSIDNDLHGTEVSIGADTALHTIVRSLDQLVSTASAHQRTFVVEVMGRNCGYLALMSALATGSEWVLLPEEELAPRWHVQMVEGLRRSRAMGRRHAMVVFAEGARHPDALPLGSAEIQRILANQLGVDVRVTVLGHVQRGGSPSAFDRVLATRLAATAVERLAAAGDETAPAMIGLIANEPVATPLPEVVEQSGRAARELDEGNYAAALGLRTRAFREALAVRRSLSSAEPHTPAADAPAVAILTGGADAPGMNAAVRAAARTALTAGYRVVGVEQGFRGLVEGRFRPLEWMSVSGWTGRGGTELGTTRYAFAAGNGDGDLSRAIEQLQAQRVGALICLGGWNTYRQAARLADAARSRGGLPVLCVPATIDNNLPATDFSIGADTALNSIVEAIDKIKHTSVPTHRAFLVEVMGRECGYLAQLSALASGAERAYLPEEGLSLTGLLDDLRLLSDGFRRGKKLGILVRNERASGDYDTDFIRRVLEEEGGDDFEARAAVLGHLQRGGTPSPFDRILGARLGAAAATAVANQLQRGGAEAQAIGMRGQGIEVTPLDAAFAEMDPRAERPASQWWLPLRDLARVLAQPEPGWPAGGAEPGSP